MILVFIGMIFEPRISLHAQEILDLGIGFTIDKDDAKNWKNDDLGIDLPMSQRALVTIGSQKELVTRNSLYSKDKLGKWTRKLPFDPPGACGGDVTLDDGTRFVTTSIGTKTTNEQVLNFIKIHSEISEKTN